MGFSFGFTGDDIEESAATNSASRSSSNPVDEFMDTDMAIAGPYKPSAQGPGELLLKSAPLRMSFGLVKTSDGTVVPRRDLYDVKYQLMSQDSLSETDEILLGTTNEDLRAATYEGGLKVWECSFDLLGAISSEADDLERLGSCEKPAIIELGCGAGLPSLYLFHKILTSGVCNIKLVLADYNESVLRLLTAPNMFLTWWSVIHGATNDGTKLAGEIDVAPELIKEFEANLSQRGIELLFVSGAWSPQFVRLVGQNSFDLVLASETIYSLETLPVFTDTMLNCLAVDGRALVAAKKIYFGVGGGIPDFVNELRRRNAQFESVSDHVEGVGRSVLKVRHPAKLR